MINKRVATREFFNDASTGNDLRLRRKIMVRLSDTTKGNV